jgi:hypothetical protein
MEIGFHTDAFNTSYWSFGQCLEWAHRCPPAKMTEREALEQMRRIYRQVLPYAERYGITINGCASSARAPGARVKTREGSESGAGDSFAQAPGRRAAPTVISERDAGASGRCPLWRYGTAELTPIDAGNRNQPLDTDRLAILPIPVSACPDQLQSVALRQDNSHHVGSSGQQERFDSTTTHELNDHSHVGPLSSWEQSSCDLTGLCRPHWL